MTRRSARLRLRFVQLCIVMAASVVAWPICAAEPEWETLVRESNAYAGVQRERLEADFRLSEHERWDLDQEKEELVFSDGGVPAVVAKFQFVGSLSTTSGTWLWGWANASILPGLSRDIARVRKYGEGHGFEKLVKRRWPAEEADGWEMAAVANYVLHGKGIYRPPFDRGYAFLVITDIRKAGH